MGAPNSGTLQLIYHRSRPGDRSLKQFISALTWGPMSKDPNNNTTTFLAFLTVSYSACLPSELAICGRLQKSSRLDFENFLAGFQLGFHYRLPSNDKPTAFGNSPSKKSSAFYLVDEAHSKILGFPVLNLHISACYILLLRSLVSSYSTVAFLDLQWLVLCFGFLLRLF